MAEVTSVIAAEKVVISLATALNPTPANAAFRERAWSVTDAEKPDTWRGIVLKPKPKPETEEVDERL